MADHPHFNGKKRPYASLVPEVKDLHRCFIDSEATIEALGVPFMAAAPRDPDSLPRLAADAPKDEHQEV